MMKKTLAFFSLVIALSGCSKDDNNDNPVQGTPKYVDKIIFEQDDESTATQIVYNDDMQVTAYVSDETTMNFVYDNNRIVSIKNENAIDPYKLYYTGGILSAIDHFSLHYTATYNSQERSYTFDEGTLTFSFGLTGKDILYADTQEYTQKFVYDTSKKGAFYSLEAENIFPLTLFADSHYYMSAAALKSITVDVDGVTKTYIAVNTYDDDGYIISSSLQSAGEELFNVQYHYIQK